MVAVEPVMPVTLMPEMVGVVPMVTPVLPVQVVAPAPPPSSDTWTVQLAEDCSLAEVPTVTVKLSEPLAPIPPDVNVMLLVLYDTDQPAADPPKISKKFEGLENLTHWMTLLESLLFTVNVKFPTPLAFKIVGETEAVQAEITALAG